MLCVGRFGGDYQAKQNQTRREHVARRVPAPKVKQADLARPQVDRERVPGERERRRIERDVGLADGRPELREGRFDGDARGFVLDFA